MRVLYDYQILYYQKYGGISRYFYELISHLCTMYPDDSFKIRAAISQNYYFRNDIPQRKLLKHGNRLLNDLCMKLDMMNGVKFGKKIDILHPTYYEPTYIRNLQNRKYKLVVTVHDMTHEHYMQEDKRFIMTKHGLLKQADGIITVSEYTKNDLLSIYPDLFSKPIRTIYHGHNITSIYTDDMSLSLPTEYILYVGTRAGYKNFSMLFDAFRCISEKHKSMHLICVGGGDFNIDERNAITEAGLEDRVLQMNLSDSELSLAYRRALCFVYPSEYEGFGIPILEAFANSCPVLLRNASCFPEIAGDAALFFDDASELSALIEQLTYDSGIRTNLLERGLKRLVLYSWERTAEETYRFYQSVI